MVTHNLKKKVYEFFYPFCAYIILLFDFKIWLWFLFLNVSLNHLHFKPLPFFLYVACVIRTIWIFINFPHHHLSGYDVVHCDSNLLYSLTLFFFLWYLLFGHQTNARDIYIIFLVLIGTCLLVVPLWNKLRQSDFLAIRAGLFMI